MPSIAEWFLWVNEFEDFWRKEARNFSNKKEKTDSSWQDCWIMRVCALFYKITWNEQVFRINFQGQSPTPSFPNHLVYSCDQHMNAIRKEVYHLINVFNEDCWWLTSSTKHNFINGYIATVIFLSFQRIYLLFMLVMIMVYSKSSGFPEWLNEILFYLIQY